MALQFNGSTFTLNNGSADILADGAITGFSIAGGDRSEIDVTTSTSTRRESVAGFASARRLEVQLLVDGGLTLAELDAMMTGCTVGSATVKVKPDCAGVAAAFFSAAVYLMSYDINSSLDETLQMSVSMMIAE